MNYQEPTINDVVGITEKINFNSNIFNMYVLKNNILEYNKSNNNIEEFKNDLIIITNKADLILLQCNYMDCGIFEYDSEYYCYKNYKIFKEI